MFMAWKGEVNVEKFLACENFFKETNFFAEVVLVGLLFIVFCYLICGKCALMSWVVIGCDILACAWFVFSLIRGSSKGSCHELKLFQGVWID